MAILRIHYDGVLALQMKLDLLQGVIGERMAAAAMNAASDVAQRLSDAAPRGKNPGGAAIGDDEGGPLSTSFVPQPGGGCSSSVITTQGNKTTMVVNGTGEFGPSGQRIVPKSKKALSWPGAEHPVRSVRGMRPNDFVSEALTDADDIVRKNFEFTAEEILSVIV